MALPHSRIGLIAKRALDILGAGIGLLVSGPLLLLLAWAVRRDSAGPAFFAQQRLGRGGRPFPMYKLRTMVVGAESRGAGLGIDTGDPRITRTGRWLRSTSLDELPQLWNILRGDMSFIGPRALPTRYLERWTERQRLRLSVPQGITGWAQVVGRNELSWPERFELDVWYVEHWSLWLDLKIALMTIGAVLGRRGIAGSDGTVAEFMGEGAKDDPPPPR